MSIVASRNPTPSTRGPFWKRWTFRQQEKVGGTLLLLPALIVLTLTSTYPLLLALFLSFHRWRLTVSPERTFIGVQNYISAFNDPDFRHSLAISFEFVIVTVAIEAVVGMILALLLTRGGGKVIRLARSGLLVPMVMTPVVVGILWRMLLNPDFGIVNYVLTLFGLGKQTWLSSSRHALWAIMVTDIWKWIPFTTLCFTAGLTALNPELNEAAYVDGASAWQVFWRITLPLMRPVILVTLLLRFVDSFKVLDAVYVMTYGGPGNTTDLISFFIYRTGLGFFKVGYGSSLAMLFIVFVFVITFYWIRQRQNLEQF